MARIHLTDRKLFWIRGVDVLVFLDRILTQSVAFAPGQQGPGSQARGGEKQEAVFRDPDAIAAEISVGPDPQIKRPVLRTQCRYGALLTPQGRLLGDLFVVRPGEGADQGGSSDPGILLDISSVFADALIADMLRYRLRAKIEIVPAPECRVSWTDEDCGAGCVLDPRPSMGWRDYVVGLAARTDISEDQARHDALISSDANPDEVPGPIAWWSKPAHDVVQNRFTAPGLSDYHRMRIGSGIVDPAYDSRMGADFVSDLNLDLVHAMDYHKGCFIGQEVASRMKRKSEVKRRALRVRLSEPPRFPLVYGADLVADGQLLGTIRQGIGREGIAVIRLDRLEDALANRQSIRIASSGMPDLDCEVAALPSFDEERLT